MEPSLKDKVAIVTGGSRGIGYTIAERLVDSGARVMIVGRTAHTLAGAAERLGPACVWQACHVTDQAGAAAVMTRTLEELGPVDLLVNNAAANPQWGPTIDIDEPLARKLTDVDLWAPLLWSQLAWRSSMRERGGAIVNISSVGSMGPLPFTGYYNAAKAALNYLTGQLSVELAPTVRVNCVAPGLIDTDMAEQVPGGQRSRVIAATPLRRAGTPAEVASAVLFLLSDRAAFITGAVLPVDGGGSGMTGALWPDAGSAEDGRA